ncbi:BA75_04988T0 [Komagataella pastoris]|uniref:BA75_04988T0 n=1 Tax=Komagataella pastoris TaxID=4922 RepID=A0A1B2JI35_PICPA|nr:BA75_04988T0 [Komagataella pastoris]
MNKLLKRPLLTLEKASCVRFTAISKRNRIQVQLLKDFPGVGARGEVVNVRPSLMINTLHHNNGACYILPGQEPRIPVVEKKHEVRQKESLSAHSETRATKANSKPSMTPDLLAKLTGLSFKESTSPSKTENSDSTNDLELATAIQDMPKVIFMRYATDDNGTLKNEIRKDRLSEHLFKLTGFTIPTELITIQYMSPNGPIDLDYMDFVGDYTLTFKLSSAFDPIVKNAKIISSNIDLALQKDLVRP